jgi:nucleotide-binding universal stress UspA family protein
MEPLKWDRILVPTDLSPLSRKAVDYAHALAERVQAELHVLHVVRDVNELAKEHGATGLLEPGAGQDDYDDWLAAIVGESGTVRRIESLRVGAHPHEVIVDYARKQNIELIVIATHGRTGLTHLLMGSVTEKVLRAAPCPVLVIRP